MIIPTTIDGKPVRGIGDGAFRDCHELTSVTIPEGVMAIGNGAFQACHVLKSVTMPSEMTKIGDNAFGECFALKSVTISAKQVGSYAFGGCKELASVTLASNVESIDPSAFRWCGTLKEFKVDSGNKKFIAIDGVLYTKDCKELVLCPGGVESVTIPARVSAIRGWDHGGNGAFIGCPKLKRICVEKDNQKYASVDGVLYTKDMSTLVACPGTITTLAIPSGVVKIENTAFYATEITSLTMPSSLTNYIGYHAFCNCGKLKSLTISARVGWGAFDVAGIESVSILSTAKRVEDCAFLNCGNLKEVTIEEGVESIGSSSFAGCGSLKSITVPASVKTLGENTFGGCGRMTMVTMFGERPAAGKDVFNNCQNVAVIHVPAKAKSWAGMKEWQGKPLVFDAK